MNISTISNYIDMYGRAYACMPVYACMYEEGRGERFMHVIKLTRFARPEKRAERWAPAHGFESKTFWVRVQRWANERIM